MNPNDNSMPNSIINQYSIENLQIFLAAIQCRLDFWLLHHFSYKRNYYLTQPTLRYRWLKQIGIPFFPLHVADRLEHFAILANANPLEMNHILHDVLRFDPVNQSPIFLMIQLRFVSRSFLLVHLRLLSNSCPIHFPMKNHNDDTPNLRENVRQLWNWQFLRWMWQ